MCRGRLSSTAVQHVDKKGQKSGLRGSCVDDRLSVRRIGEMVFGLLAIVARVGLIVGIMAGGQVSSVLLVAFPLVVIGWAVYYGIVARPVDRSGTSRRLR